MPNPHGSFVWYELLTTDVAAASDFYGDVIGWTARDAGVPGVDYHLFAAADGQDVAGHMALPAGPPRAMRPAWLGYIGVDDVDATVAAIEADGGRVHMPPTDLPGVGRMAMIADPQGIPFYVMRGASDGESRSWSVTEAGHCRWNELSTSDQDGALRFDTRHFRWEPGEAMPMGEMGEYRFIHHGGVMIGAMMRAQHGGAPANWNFYFGVPDIDAAVARIKAGGGAVHHGPMQIPGGEYSAFGSDPQGVAFGVVGPRRAGDAK
jgi:predicted enzyme related to lactoylglutathione lyase